jgi:hypothetical protein
MHELVAPEGDGHVRGTGVGCGKEEEISGVDLGEIHVESQPELIAHRTGERYPVTAEDVLREAAAIEPVGIGTAILVRDAAQ